MKLSIITINYNNAKGLQKTMESVLKQTYRDYEYIIVDGASTDGSVDVIREYVEASPKSSPEGKDLHDADNSSLPSLQGRGRERLIVWTSEPDNGIYDAMNRGIRKASGEYLLFLNSGDYLVDESVIGRIVSELGKADIIQGNVFLDKVGGELRRGYGKSDLSFIEVYEGNFLHQATFFRSSLFEEYGMYDENIRLGGDTFFYLKALGLGSASFLYIDQMISVFMSDGLSSSKEGYWYEVIKKEDTLYDAQVPPRILRLVKEDRKKYELYDILHRYPIIWELAMLLKKIALKKMVRGKSKK